MTARKYTLRTLAAVVCVSSTICVGAAQADAPPAPGTTGQVPAGPASPTSLCTIRGTAHADVLRGRRGHVDVICGFGGNDTIYATGDDIVIAGGGDDTIYARNGRTDTIDGGSGRDKVRIDPRDSYANVEYRF